MNAGELPWQLHMSFDILSEEILENIDFTRKKKNKQMYRPDAWKCRGLCCENFYIYIFPAIAEMGVHP